MAATKYQVLYRYINPNSNQFVLNDVDTKYKGIFEFYHDKHKLISGTKDEKLEANNEKSELIVEGNNTANDNYNMLFKFAGTKRINKRVWKPESTGYVIRDKEAVRDKITRAVDGDYSGDYLLIEGDTIENGVVITKKNPIPITGAGLIVTDKSTDAQNGSYYTSAELTNLIINSTICKLKSTDLADYKVGNTSYPTRRTGSSWAGYTYEDYVFTGPVFIDKMPSTISGNWSTRFGVTLGENACSYVAIQPSHIETYTIPAHYEYDADYPYVVCDTYERIEQSPWFILSTHGSLTSALEKAKMMVKAIGLDNVKVIKVVPTDQFIKIK